MSDIVRTYEPSGPTLKRFHESSAFVRGLMGPFGSAKSSSCVMEILIKSMQQAPGPDGVRRTRWAVVRNTYPELKTTTIKTWAQWCPTSFGKLNQDSPITHHIKQKNFDMEVLFIALDKPDDVRKLLSLELTGAWINEAREIPKAMLDAITARVGRYPAKMDGGPSWYGVLMDTNPPDDQHWWFNYEQNETPEDWEFFIQPSGLSPQAENLQNLPDKYYQRLMQGKDPDWVKVYVEGKYGYVVEGKPVYPMYLDSTHASPVVIEPDPRVAIFLGADWGVSSACAITQKLPNGQWRILDEYISDDGRGITAFGENLAAYIALMYPGFEVGGAWGDPSGENKTLEGNTPLALMKAATGWDWKPAPTNDIDMRLEVVRAGLRRLVDGQPGILVSPKAKVIRKGFTGGYHYKLFNDGTQTYELPNKNRFSHPHDGVQYVMLGGGEGSVVLNKQKRDKGRKPRFAQGMDTPVFGKRS